MKFVRIYSFHGEPMADVMLDGKPGRLELLIPFEPHRVDLFDQYHYCHYEITEQKMIRAKPTWLEPT